MIAGRRRCIRSIRRAGVSSRANESGRLRLRRDSLRGGTLALALVGVGLVAAACGVGSASPGVASAGSSSTTTVVPAAASPSSSTALYEDELKFSQCMRTHGVPNFPDPNAGGGFRVPVRGSRTSSPAFEEAQAKCQRLLPGGGIGSGAPPTAQAVAQMLKVAQCMRRHGISNFPEPRTTVPSNRNPADISEIADRDGVILVFPAGFDQQSPQFTKAAAWCGFQVTNH